ncbi:MAG: dehydrogenase [Myxococcaceae bacterium]|nr:dehydrogenase [Myxococcaceae bacterium]
MSALEAKALNFALASRLTAYPGQDFRAAIDGLVASGAGDATLGGGLLERAEDLDEARSEFLALFDVGSERTPLYETEYGRMRGMSKGTELADLNGFYRAFGLGSPDGENEMGDHLAVELEFYAVMLARQSALAEGGDADGVGIVEDARKKFLLDHLGRFVGAIAQRQNVSQSALYGRVFEWVRALVEAECQALGVQPAALDFHGLDPSADAEPCCGAVEQLKSNPSPGKPSHA